MLGDNGLGLDELRQYVDGLPEVEETAHGGLAGFRVAGAPFVVLEEGATHAVVFVSAEEGASVAAVDPDMYEEVWREGEGDSPIFVGLRVSLEGVPAGRLAELAEHAWRNQAPSAWLRPSTPPRQDNSATSCLRRSAAPL